MLEVALAQTAFSQWDGLVVVVEVYTRAVEVRSGRKCARVVDRVATEAGERKHSRECDIVGGNVATGVSVSGGSLFGICCNVLRRKPQEHWHMDLVVSWDWRGMEETVAVVVEDIFAMVGEEKHGGRAFGLLKQRNDGVEHHIRFADGVVVSVEELSAVVTLCIGVIVGGEESMVARVSVAVAEVVAVGMEYDEGFTGILL